ncbi:MAG: ATP phosphoribosyltransferase, partial [Pseudomonadota bacterium]|nr:ATP phosphoribosyltransferase [Pseudomonadota bacterium]
MKNLILGIPSKGRLMEQAQELLVKAGYAIERIGSERGYRGRLIGLQDIEVAFLSAQDIASGLKSGAVDFGVTGEDLLRETIAPDNKVADVILRLNFGPADVVVGVPDF